MPRNEQVANLVNIKTPWMKKKRVSRKGRRKKSAASRRNQPITGIMISSQPELFSTCGRVLSEPSGRFGLGIRAPRARFDFMNAVAELGEISEECSEPGWDGYRALPIDMNAILEAVLFLARLPSILRAPDVTPNPNGGITFEWRNGQEEIFLVTVTGASKLTWASIFGAANKMRGLEPFSGTVPAAIWEPLSKHFKQQA